MQEIRLSYSFDIHITFFVAVLRKAVDETSSESILAVFMSFASGCQFHILKPIISAQQIRIVRLNTLHSLEVIIKDCVFFLLVVINIKIQMQRLYEFYISIIFRTI